MLSNKLVWVASNEDLPLVGEGATWHWVTSIWFCNSYTSSRKAEILTLLIRRKKS